MRKVVSIALVVLVLLNTIGYYGIFLGLQHQNTQELIQRLDAQDYGEKETITLKIPLVIPYPINTDEYQRVDGEVEHNGEFYRLVKQRHSHDTLYVVCIKDHESKQIKQALADYVKTFTDKPVNSKQNLQISLIKYCLSSHIELTPCVKGWDCSLASFNTEKGVEQHPFLHIHTPPPKNPTELA